MAFCPLGFVVPHGLEKEGVGGVAVPVYELLGGPGSSGRHAGMRDGDVWETAFGNARAFGGHPTLGDAIGAVVPVLAGLATDGCDSVGSGAWGATAGCGMDGAGSVVVDAACDAVPLCVASVEAAWTCAMAFCPLGFVVPHGLAVQCSGVVCVLLAAWWRRCYTCVAWCWVVPSWAWAKSRSRMLANIYGAVLKSLPQLHYPRGDPDEVGDAAEPVRHEVLRVAAAHRAHYEAPLQRGVTESVPATEVFADPVLGTRLSQLQPVPGSLLLVSFCSSFWCALLGAHGSRQNPHGCRS